MKRCTIPGCPRPAVGRAAVMASFVSSPPRGPLRCLLKNVAACGLDLPSYVCEEHRDFRLEDFTTYEVFRGNLLAQGFPPPIRAWLEPHVVPLEQDPDKDYPQ